MILSVSSRELLQVFNSFSKLPILTFFFSFWCLLYALFSALFIVHAKVNSHVFFYHISLNPQYFLMNPFKFIQFTRLLFFSYFSNLFLFFFSFFLFQINSLLYFQFKGPVTLIILMSILIHYFNL